MPERERLLLHVCCGPCSTAVIERLRGSYELALYFYNPNIYPREEWELRAAEAEGYARDRGLPFIRGEWSHDEWLEAVRGLEAEPEGGRRCERCFELRLLATARLAAELGIPLFTTTLTVSPHKRAAQVNAAGERAVAALNREVAEDGSFGESPGGLREGAVEGGGEGRASGRESAENGRVCRVESCRTPVLGEMALPRFLAEDFKKRDGFLTSCRISKEAGMRRQDYCGCEFSMRMR